MTDAILTLEGLHTDIAQYHILQGVDLAVPRGGVTMLLGRNGVGKTTTLRSIIGHWKAKSGTIRFDGQDITTLPTPARARLGFGFVP
ncbi:MAG: ATP-binding cassette domain-containing protein, partial [Rhodobacteraceae bacterium]|nr:ATP-binding cassette domain-containing protein [Paracoccaceae bacterium]